LAGEVLERDGLTLCVRQGERRRCLPFLDGHAVLLVSGLFSPQRHQDTKRSGLAAGASRALQAAHVRPARAPDGARSDRSPRRTGGSAARPSPRPRHQDRAAPRRSPPPPPPPRPPRPPPPSPPAPPPSPRPPTPGRRSPAPP